MQPLLQQESDEAAQISKLHIYWDKIAVFIHIFQQFYWYFLICYYWNINLEFSRYGMTVSLAISSFLGFIINIIWISVKSNSYNRTQKVFAWIVVIYCPLSIIFLYLNNARYLLYGLLFTQTLFTSIPIFLINCYYLIHFYENDNILLVISIVLFAFSILFLYPLFMPLQTMNYKLLTLKLTTFSLQIIRILFTVYLFYYVIYPQNEVFNDMIYHIYTFYLMKLFWISPCLVLWIFIWISFQQYTLDWFYVKNLKEIWKEYNDSSCYIKVICCSCLTARILINIFIIYPEYLILLGSFYIIYLWIFLEFYVFNILDVFIFYNQDSLYSNELYGFKLNNYNFSIWNLIFKYLTNINDDLNYNERLYILHFLYYSKADIEADIENTNVFNGMQCILQGMRIRDPIQSEINSFYKLFVMKFFYYLVNQCGKLKMDVFFSVRTKLLQFYDFESGTFVFECKYFIGIFWELIGVFIIIPVYIISTLLICFVLPIIMYILYFYRYSDGYYMLDFKFWILNIYILLLIIMLILLIYQYKLVKIWYDCRLLVNNNNILPIQHIYKYHNYIRNKRMIYCILSTFFGTLSTEIMKYLGMMDNDDMICVPCDIKLDIDDNDQLYEHDDSVLCDEYVFDLNIQ